MDINIFNNSNDFLDSYFNDYDIIFMNIEMMGVNGIEVSREIRKVYKRVVTMVITNMAQFAINGYEVFLEVLNI